MKGNRGEEERFRPRFRFVASLAEGPARLSRASQVLFSFQVKVVRLHGPLTGARPFRLASWLPRTESGEKAASGASQAARASSRILPHRPCRVVMELNSGKGTGTR